MPRKFAPHCHWRIGDPTYQIMPQTGGKVVGFCLVGLMTGYRHTCNRILNSISYKAEEDRRKPKKKKVEPERKKELVAHHKLGIPKPPKKSKKMIEDEAREDGLI